MNKSRYAEVFITLFIVMVGLTLLNLYYNIIWLSYALIVGFLVIIMLHIKEYGHQNPKNMKIFLLSLFVLINFFLTNCVIVIANYVYPY